MKLLICFLFTASVYASAQTSPQAVVERMNEALLSIEKGEYQVSNKFKSLLDLDTNAHAGLVRYYKTEGGAGDTLARFVLWPAGGGAMQGSDGETYFLVRKDSVIATDPLRQKKGLISYVSKGSGLRSATLSLPILTNRGHTPINPDKWKAAKVGQFVLNDTVFVELYQRRMFPIQMKITPTSKDSMIYTEQWLLYPDTYTPRRIRNWADQQDGHVQFDEFNYSRIQLLPPDAAFETDYNVAEMVKNGYRVAEINRDARKKRPEIAVGDTVPDFMARLETGEVLPLFSAFQQRYIVVDFWYRSCAPCNIAMPGIDRTARALHGKDIAFVGVNPIDKQYDKLIAQYKQQYGYSFQIAFTERAVADQMKINTYPKLVVIDRLTRRVIYLEDGYSDGGEKALFSFLEALVR